MTQNQTPSIMERISNFWTGLLESMGGSDAPVTTAPPDPFGGKAPVVPTNPRPAIMAGLLVLLITFGGFGTWAATAQLNSAVIASGQIKVSTSNKAVQPLEGGSVAEIMVSNGDQVEEGDVLVRLDATTAQADLLRVQGQLDQTEATVARLIAERDSLEEVVFTEELLARAEADDSVAEILQGQRTLFTARQATITGQLSLIEERIKQLDEEIRGLEVQSQARREQIATVNEELEDKRDLRARGWGTKTEILRLERARSQYRGELGDFAARISQARVQIGEARLEIIQADKAYKEQVVSELRQRETERFDLRQTLEKSKFQKRHTEVRATDTGVVTNKSVSAIGQVVRAGDIIMEIVPEDDTLIVEAKVQPFDIDNVQQGLQADVQLSAFSQRDTPRVHGEVTYVSADVKVDERTGMPYYTARISVPAEQLEGLGDDRALKPGMPADVFIQTGKRTPFNYLVQPIQDSMSRAWRET